MTDPNHKDDPAARRAVIRTAVVLAVVAFGIYAAFIASGVIAS